MLRGSPGREIRAGLRCRGLLRKEGGHARRRLTGIIAEKAREPRVLIVSKANTRSTVHRASYMDYIGVKTFGPDGLPNGEHRFVGLFTSRAYHAPLSDIPVVAAKLDRVLEARPTLTTWPRSPRGWWPPASAGRRCCSPGRTCTGGSCPAPC